jgi:7-cyano-7-deazaguanine reductase
VSDAPLYGAQAIAANRLERWPNPAAERDYLITISAPEFTCLCPRSNYPDFATIEIRYVPDAYIVELRSLKLYINSFRGVAISHEAATNRILDDLAELLEPRWLEIRGDFYPRGNVHTVVTVRRRREGWEPGPDVLGAWPERSEPADSHEDRQVDRSSGEPAVESVEHPAVGTQGDTELT